jgi:hypothetical protein
MESKESSPDFVIAASFAALVVFIWGVLLDWHFVIGEWDLTLGQIGIAALMYTAIIAGWFWAIVGARGGSRGAQYVLLGYAILLCVYALQDLFVYCPNTCPNIWLYYIANWGNLLAGILAGVAVGMGLGRSAAS